MYTHRTRMIAWIALVLFLLGACNLPGDDGPPEQLSRDVIYTQAAQTMQAQLTRNAPTPAPPDQSIHPPVEDTPTPTATPPADTPTITPTHTPTLTNTPAVPTISAIINTNCRQGPSKAYNIVGVLAVDQKAEVHGRDSANSWWYIQNLSKPGQFCWVWRDTTMVEGDTSGLPIVAPPPTPTYTVTPGASFGLSYSTVHDCGGIPTAIFQVDNNGGGNLDSLNLKIDDLTASVTLFGPASSDAPFMGATGECPPGGDVLNSGKTLYVGGAIGAAPSGNTARATVRLCTENGLGGTCVEKTIDFTIP